MATDMNLASYPVIDEALIQEQLKKVQTFDEKRFSDILDRALETKGLSIDDTAFLLNVRDPEAIERMTRVAVQVKEKIYGRRLVLFAPLYTSSFCSNECLYCGFRATLHSSRKRLNLDEIRHETEALINMGHKRVLMVAGEDATLSADDIRKQVEAIYSVKLPKGNIRRVNVNVAPTSEENFRIIKSSGIGTYQCFQETYHRETYRKMHVKGKKTDYDYRLHVFDRAIKGGIDDFGMGVLFGLYDCRFEILAMLQHIAFLEKHFGIGPHTISIPRLEAAEGCDVHETSSHLIKDNDLVLITAILRLTVPYTGIILSTRESIPMRTRLLDVGVSQMSAGSITNPGGYAEHDDSAAQFAVQDHRSLDEVIRSACTAGFVPSFCTGCYRRGRTGEAFQHLAKDHHISPYCSLNALTTLQEYLEDFATPETRAAGEACIARFLTNVGDPTQRSAMESRLAEIRSGKRDLDA